MLNAGWHQLHVEALDLSGAGETREGAQVQAQVQLESDHARVSFTAGWVRVVQWRPLEVARLAGSLSVLKVPVHHRERGMVTACARD